MNATEHERTSWRIDRILLTNMRCFPYLDLELSPLTVLVGRNGSGKTAVLDALAILLAPVVRELGGAGPTFQGHDAHRRAQDLRSSRAVATIEPIYPVVAEAYGTINGHAGAWAMRRASGRGGTSRGSAALRAQVRDLAATARDLEGDGPRLPVIAYYGVERLVGKVRPPGRGVASRFDAYTDALRPRSDLNRMSEYFEGLSRQAADAYTFQDDPPQAALDQLAAVEEACATLLESTGWSRPRWNPVVNELTLSHEREGTLPLSWLSTGTKVAAGLAFDLASRMARANPELGGSELLRTTPGIVLIDEIDLHLHPAWQQQIVPSLCKTFPSVQFIVTTHSPQVLSTVEAGAIRIIQDDEVRRPAHSEGLRSDVVLREVQGTDPVPEVPVRRELRYYLDQVFRGDGASAEARAMREEIERKLGGITYTDELAQADAFMALADLEL